MDKRWVDLVCETKNRFEIRYSMEAPMSVLRQKVSTLKVVQKYRKSIHAKLCFVYKISL